MLNQTPNEVTKLKIIECPRDAMQGMDEFIPTATKIKYLNCLLKVGFDTLDFGSFVSPKAIPQMRDTADVVKGLALTSTKLLAIVANTKGAEQACSFDEITYLGFPLSLSETFQQRNTNKSIQEALVQIEEIQSLAVRHRKMLVIYLSMGFGNPYGDPYDMEYVGQYVNKLHQLGITIICPSDTIGVATEADISSLFTSLFRTFPSIEFGAHLHATPTTARRKIAAALEAGCTRIDGAIRGFGGCPMAKDELTGNIATEEIVAFCESNNHSLTLNKQIFQEALLLSQEVFPI